MKGTKKRNPIQKHVNFMEMELVNMEYPVKAVTLSTPRCVKSCLGMAQGNLKDAAKARNVINFTQKCAQPQSTNWSASMKNVG